jgi:hypothetical protein
MDPLISPETVSIEGKVQSIRDKSMICPSQISKSFPFLERFPFENLREIDSNMMADAMKSTSFPDVSGNSFGKIKFGHSAESVFRSEA